MRLLHVASAVLPVLFLGAASFAQPAGYVPPTREETQQVSKCLADLGHPEHPHEAFVRSKVYGENPGDPRIESPEGYIEFIVPKMYWGSFSSNYISQKVFMFTIPYGKFNLDGKVYTVNKMKNRVNARQFRLGILGHFLDSRAYFDHIMNGTDIPDDYIIRMDGSAFGKSDELVEFDYSNPGFMSEDNNFFLKGSARDPEMIVDCTIHIGKICTSWTNLPNANVEDMIEIRYHESLISTASELADLLDYTEKTFSCMRPEV